MILHNLQSPIRAQAMRYYAQSTDFDMDFALQKDLGMRQQPIFLHSTVKYNSHNSLVSIIPQPKFRK